MSQPEEFALTPAEEAFFRRFFHRLALPYVTVGCVIAAIALVGGFSLVAGIVPIDSVGQGATPASSPRTEPAPQIDVRAEVERVVAELAAAQSRRGDAKASDAVRRAEELAEQLEAVLQRVAVLEGRIAAAPPPAAPASRVVPVPADADGLRERLYNLELRQDRVETARTVDTKSLLDRVANLEVFRHELEQKRGAAESRILDRLHTVEERLSQVE